MLGGLSTWLKVMSDFSVSWNLEPAMATLVKDFWCFPGEVDSRVCVHVCTVGTFLCLGTE
jgi:hypothetical protein